MSKDTSMKGLTKQYKKVGQHCLKQSRKGYSHKREQAEIDYMSIKDQKITCGIKAKMAGKNLHQVWGIGTVRQK